MFHTCITQPGLNKKTTNTLPASCSNQALKRKTETKQIFQHDTDAEQRTELNCGIRPHSDQIGSCGENASPRIYCVDLFVVAVWAAGVDSVVVQASLQLKLGPQARSCCRRECTSRGGERLCKLGEESLLGRVVSPKLIAGNRVPLLWSP